MSKTVEFKYDIGDEVYLVQHTLRKITFSRVIKRQSDSLGTTYTVLGALASEEMLYANAAEAINFYLKMEKFYLSFSSSSCEEIKRLCLK